MVLLRLSRINQHPLVKRRLRQSRKASVSNFHERSQDVFCLGSKAMTSRSVWPARALSWYIGVRSSSSDNEDFVFLIFVTTV